MCDMDFGELYVVLEVSKAKTQKDLQTLVL